MQPGVEWDRDLGRQEEGGRDLNDIIHHKKSCEYLRGCRHCGACLL